MGKRFLGISVGAWALLGGGLVFWLVVGLVLVPLVRDKLGPPPPVHATLLADAPLPPAPANALLHTKLLPDAKDRVLDAGGQAKVLIPGGLLDTPAVLTVTPGDKPSPADTDEALGQVVDVKLQGAKWQGLLGIELSRQVAPDAARRTAAVTFDPVQKRWMPADFTYDPATRKVTVWTPHLSVFAQLMMPQPKPDPMLRIPESKVPFPGIVPFANQGEAQRILEAANRDDKPTVQLAGWQAFNDWFNLSGGVTTVGELALEVESLGEINKWAGFAGVGFGLLQIAIDLKTGENRDAALNAYKNSFNSAVGLFGWSALQLACVSVTVIDYSLNKFGTTAIGGRNDLIERVYRRYYEKVTPRSPKDWYKVLRTVTKNVKAATEGRGAIDAELDAYVKLAWNDVDKFAELWSEIARQPATAMGGTGEELEKTISANHKSELVNGYLVAVLQQLQRDLEAEARGKQWQLLQRMANDMNQSRKVHVVVKRPPSPTGEESTQSLAGLPLRIAVSAGEQMKWRGETDKSGEWTMEFTGFGWWSTGRPKEVRLTLGTGKDVRDVVKKFKCPAAGGKVEVEFVLQDKIEGVWEIYATVQKAKLDASLQGIEAMAPAYGADPAEVAAGKREVEQGAVGKKTRMPDLDMAFTYAGMSWKQAPEGEFIKIWSPLAERPNSLGYTTYWVKLTDEKHFVGKALSVGRFGGKENRMEFTVSGTRIR
jgi:hypothetical protein